MFPFTCRSVHSALNPPLGTGCGPWTAAPIDPVPQPVAEPDIGVVVFSTHKGEWAEAVLDAAGKWRCPKLPVLERPLDALYGPRRDTGGEMPYGHAELIRVAVWLKGVAKVRRP